MAFASSLSTSMAVPCLPSSRNEGHFSVRFRPTHMVFPGHRLRLGLSTVACARRRSTDAAVSKKNKKQRSSRKDRDEEEEEDDDDDDDMDDDAFEALFNQLEEDLKNDTSSMDGDDDGMMDDDAFEALFEELERDLKNDSSSMDDDDDGDITEENFVKVERALAEAFGPGSDDEDEEEEEEEDDDDEEEEEEEEEFKLKNWQFRRIASALKVGRRKLSIKLLAEELCLDRAVVLKILRDPPPKLLMYSASLPDYVPPTPIVSETETETETEIETEPVETVPAIIDVEPPEPKVNAPVPVHVRQSRWSGQKRLKKVHALTLEQVYRKTKRPNDAMVDSIVLVTNLPRKVIVKWFEEKRAENGVPEKYPAPYQRSAKKSGVPDKYPAPYKRSAHKTAPSQ